MGCDIHSVAQVLKDGKWVTKLRRPGGDDRDYNSFAVLANVRNGAGFAGCKTGEGWPYIDEPRGLPSDFEFDATTDHHPLPSNLQEPRAPHDDPYRILHKQALWMGDHSHSHVTLAEIEAHLENRIPRKYKKTGVVTRETFEALESGKLSEPEEWCGWTSGPSVKVATAKQARAGEPHTHVQIDWTTDARKSLYMLTECVQVLRQLAKDEGVRSDHVRLVFGFDS